MLHIVFLIIRPGQITTTPSPPPHINIFLEFIIFPYTFQNKNFRTRKKSCITKSTTLKMPITPILLLIPSPQRIDEISRKKRRKEIRGGGGIINPPPLLIGTQE